jgi:hypothetical protein
MALYRGVYGGISAPGSEEPRVFYVTNVIQQEIRAAGKGVLNPFASNQRSTISKIKKLTADG